MLLKLSGAVIVLSCGAMLGYVMGERFKSEIEILKSLERCLMIIESEIRYMGTAACDIYLRLGNENEVFAPVFYELYLMFEKSFVDVNRLLANPVIRQMSAEDKKEFERFAATSYGQDKQKEIGRIELYRNRVHDRVDFLTKTVNDRIKLFRILGISFGGFIVILVI